MDDLPRLIISDERIKSAPTSYLTLSLSESHYLNKVMRLKKGNEVFIVNGKGKIWKGKLIKEKTILLPDYGETFLSIKKKTILLGLAISIPKKGFEDIIRMSTELGIDYIKPLYSDRQIKKISNISERYSRWDTIINESLEQSERLWRPEILSCTNIFEWIDSIIKNDKISISVTRKENCLTLNEWLHMSCEILCNENKILWNVIGPEGGWSKNELNLFESHKIQCVALSENILRTSTAAVNASVNLSQWRENKLK